MVDVYGQNSNGISLKEVLVENGCEVLGCYMDACSMVASIDQIKSVINTVPEIVKIKPAIPMLNHKQQEPNNRHADGQRLVRRNLQDRDLQGSVTSEAIRAMFVDVARSRYSNINGTGITVGIMSDSFDCKGDQAQIDILTGDLPPLSRINVLADLPPSDEYCIDEGRAMMQLVYDVAPGANFAFHTAFRGEADFAAGIQALVDVGCQIIVDDVLYLEPFFQDGIISQSVDQAVTRGVSYFTSVGNFGNYAWEGKTGFQKSNITAGEFGMFHSFGRYSDGSPIVFQRFSIKRKTGEVLFAFQWDEPLVSPTGSGGSRSEVDIYVFNETGSLISTPPFVNIGGDPIDAIVFETIGAESSGNSDVLSVYVAILLKEGPAPTYMKTVSWSGGKFEFSDGSEASNMGHENSASGASVGAAYFRDTPAYGVSPPEIEPFSSYGGTPVFFDKNGIRLPKPETRQQPRFTGPDGIQTTFFSGTNKTFFGTSASAPNVAGVAALILQLQAGGMTPNTLFQILESTSIDMTTTVGFDFISGNGFVNASRALDVVSSNIPSKAPNPAPTKSPTRVPTKAPALPPIRTDVSPTRQPCGLFGASIFCPFTFGGVFGRFIRHLFRGL